MLLYRLYVFVAAGEDALTGHTQSETKLGKSLKFEPILL
jgi:hypothetical protein